MRDGQLSPAFPEVAVKASSSFAHDRGMMSQLESLTVGGKPCSYREVFQRLLAHRKGWTKTGGSSAADALATFEAFTEAWGKAFEHSTRLTTAKAPAGIGADYHPPRYALYELDDGDKIVVHSYFQSWDGGNHGTQFAFEVEAYRVSTGAYYELRLPKARLGQPAEPTGPQPVDPKVPRPRHLSGW